MYTATLLLAFGLVAVSGQQSSNAPPRKPLTLQEYRRLVLEGNETAQGKYLEYQVSKRRYRAEKGAFEPDFIASYERDDNKRKNTSVQSAAEFGAAQFAEANNIYSGGLESLVPTGTKVRLGYTLQELRNTLQSPTVHSNGEWVTFFGVTATQPLLKNAGFTANLANLRLAALDSDVAFQQYRRQLMVAVSSAEAAYWNLYMIQEQVRFFEESVQVAETILKDSRARLDAGQGSELDVMEARSGLAFRQTKLADAREKLAEAVNQVLALYGATPINGNERLVAVDKPELLEVHPSFFQGWRNAYEYNPDYLAQRTKLLMADVRVGYAWNQRLPEFNLKGSYGLNGLGSTPESSWNDIETRGWPSWSFGVELRVPLTGGIRGRNELAAARLNEEAAFTAMHDMETQIASALHTAVQKVQGRRESVPRYESVVDFANNVLQTQLARLQVGRVESRKVLEADVDLFEAKNSLLETMVQYRRALLEFELVEGTTLKNRSADVTKTELAARTAAFTKANLPAPRRPETKPGES